MRIMVVDDSPSIQAYVSAFLKELGHDVISVTNGTAALAEIYDTSIDLIFMDIEMPGLNGFDTTKAMRAYLNDIWIPIIFLSSNKDDAHVVEGLEVGGDAYITKLVNLKVMEAMVNAMGRLVAMQEELHKTNLALQKQANIDILTQTVNRRGFDRALEKEFSRCRRQKKPLSIIMIDIDHFKLFNDNYGHVKGDEVLRSVGNLLGKVARRPGDLAARYGGEEFVLLLPETKMTGAIKVAGILKEQLTTLHIEHNFSPTAKHLTVSQGIATVHNFDEPIDIVDLADKALYQAKENGRNQWQFYEQEHD